jgi:hypothetical protein
MVVQLQEIERKFDLRFDGTVGLEYTRQVLEEYALYPPAYVTDGDGRHCLW